MDAIYLKLNQRLLGLQKNDEYVKAQESIANYLTLIMASEFWWRLRCRNDAEKHMNAIVSANTNTAMRAAMKGVTRLAFDNEAERSTYEQILDQLAAIQYQRNIFTHVDSFRFDTEGLPAISKIENSLRKIVTLATEKKVFPALSGWMPVIPISRGESILKCKAFRLPDDIIGEHSYVWMDFEIPLDTPEFQRNGVRSESEMQLGRLYFLKENNLLGGEDQITSAYPFVKVELKEGSLGWDYSSIWLFQSVLHRQNGACKGVDVLRKAEDVRLEIEYIPEFAISGCAVDNIYLKPAQVNYPITNVYAANWKSWIETNKARGAIKAVKNHLREGAQIVYLYGAGGIGKTAAVQKLLLEYDNPEKRYDYLVFLSAKKTEWGTSGKAREILYQNGHQSFGDLESLRLALRNIFRERDAQDGQKENHSEIGNTQEQTEKPLFEGKSILLVLDDFESVEESEQERIYEYLRTEFQSVDRKKLRQVIITCRTNPTEGHKAMVALGKLNEEEAAFFAIECADGMDSNRRDCYKAALGEAYRNKDVTGQQCQKRRVLVAQTMGLPLLIRQLVLKDPQAVIQEIMGLAPDIVEYLMKDTYKYLNSGDLKRIAVIALFLTEKMDKCSIERLQYVWDRVDNGEEIRVESYLDKMDAYGVLWYDKYATRNKLFGFAGDMRQWIAKGSEAARNGRQQAAWMRQFIKKGYEQDPEQDANLSPEGEKLAKWLGDYHDCTIPECLLRQLHNTVRCWYESRGRVTRYREECCGSGEILDANYREEELAGDMQLLGSTILRDPKSEAWQKRSVIQLILQVCLDFADDKETSALKDWLEDTLGSALALDDMSWYIELCRMLLPEHPELIKDEHSQQEIIKSLRRIGRNMTPSEDEENLLILWNTILFFEECAASGICLIPDLIQSFAERSSSLLFMCGRQQLLVEEMKALDAHMRLVVDALDGQDPCVPMLRHSLETWDSVISAHSGNRTAPKLFFGSAVG